MALSSLVAEFGFRNTRGLEDLALPDQALVDGARRTSHCPYHETASSSDLPVYEMMLLCDGVFSALPRLPQWTPPCIRAAPSAVRVEHAACPNN